MSGLLGKIPKFTLKLPASLAKAGRTLSESPLDLSFSICEEGVLRKAKTNGILHVSLPAEERPAMSKTDNLEANEKGDDEKRGKEDNMEVTCSVSVDGQEKQEFSFTLYDVDTKERANKQDVEKIVVRSICEALGKTLKLPPSGSRTIKVKLAISPDSNKDIDASALIKETKWPVDLTNTCSPCKHQDYDSSKSANTASTYLLSSTAEKQQAAYRCTASTSLPLVSNATLQQEAKAMPSPKLKPVRHNRLISLQKQEARNAAKDSHKRSADVNNQDSNRTAQSEMPKLVEDQPIKCQNPQHLITRAHVMESRERRNHYLDLAGIESNGTQQIVPKPANFSGEPNYVCPYRILDRGHVCSKAHRNKDLPISPNKRTAASNTHGLNNTQKNRTRIYSNCRDDLLNLNIDLFDLAPNVKYDWEKIHHRRSKSYDLHESTIHSTAGLYSPKLKSQNVHHAQTISDPAKNQCAVNYSPVHNFRFRHRDKERQRAMQQVANWITAEHSKEKVANNLQFIAGKITKSPQEGLENRHLHEHVHHHYHHIVDF